MMLRRYNRFFQQLRRAVTFFFWVSIGSCLLLRVLPPPTSMFMFYRHAEDLFNTPRVKSIDYQWVSSENISSYAKLAVIAGEDQLFFSHYGFDVTSILASIKHFQRGGQLRGASTISQQTAKNLFLTPSKSFIRKGLEVWFTVLLELFWDKARILEVYLNIAEFGDHLFGIEAASQHYYGISAKQLTPAQSAMLAATLPNPIHFKATQPSNYLIRRQQWILRQMRQLGTRQLDD
ncbi:MAG: monofunctional biosynthetic peptidoglycan transglycosylase [Methylovulum sp.]|jgi:monofunctional biosynthetic peptidoglycan transglycosylase|nr:monofunctional biosynthetic peptidoglycan transglycosylase [Methylovulum sp.]MCF7998374.1 monofunctional biosynthetic peptidoglycan transglycosylase [Methylovulum sp.]